MPAVEDVKIIAPLPWLFIKGVAYFAERNAPSRFTETQRCQSDSATSSTLLVGPAIPAFAQSTSIPPHSALISLNKVAASVSLEASTSEVRHVALDNAS